MHVHEPSERDDLEDPQDDADAAPERLFSRRALLGGLAGGAASLFVPGFGLPVPEWLTSSVVPQATSTLLPYRLAMHVHSSFSEGIGSMYASLAEADRAGYDLLFFTDHDHRKRGIPMRQGIHFKGSSEPETPSGTWVWAARKEGKPQAASGPSWVTNPSSPAEPGHALQIGVTAPGGTGEVFNLVDGDDSGSHKGMRMNVVGQRIQFDLRARPSSPNAWLELRLYLSYYPALAGFAAGQRVLVYRFGTVTPRVERQGFRAVLWRAIPADTWTTVEIRPDVDVAQIFTELPVPGDNHTTSHFTGRLTNVVLTLGAGARDGASCLGWFDRMHFLRTYLGQDAYDLQRELCDKYIAEGLFRTEIRLGDEVGQKLPHLQWLGGVPRPIDYDLWAFPKASEVAKIVAGVHAGGGLLQYNHPFGAFQPTYLGNQTQLLSSALALLKSTGLWATADLIEIGYQMRGDTAGAASLATHLRLFDLLARAGRFVTATGCHDDHEGIVNSWSTRTNRYATGIWAPSLREADVSLALRRGRAWCLEVEPKSTVGRMDLTVDGTVSMGSVSVKPVASRTVQLTCPVVPSGGRAVLIRGVVDYTSTDLTHRVSTFATISAAALAKGTVSHGVDTTSNCFVRAEVHDSTDRIVAFSNPIWLLRKAPPGGIPPVRAA